MPSSNPLLPENSRIVQPAYLEKHSNKSDLTRRLRKLAYVLRNDPQLEADSPDWPGLAALAARLVCDDFLEHRDKQVRLYCTLCCMEIIALYAPEMIYDQRESLCIFKSVIVQLSNLCHCTSPQQVHYTEYERLLELLATVKIGVVLVEFCQHENQQRLARKNKKNKDNQDHSSDDLSDADEKNDQNYDEDEEEDEDENNTNPLEVLAELFRALLSSVRNEHPVEIFEMVQQAIIACLDEYKNPVTVPIPLLDELLLCVGQGPTQLVVPTSFLATTTTTVTPTSAGVATATEASSQESSKLSKQQQQETPSIAAATSQKNKNIQSPQSAALQQHASSYLVEQTNPSFSCAAGILTKVHRMATPISQYLNSLLNGDPHISQQSNLSTEPPPPPEQQSKSSKPPPTNTTTNNNSSTIPDPALYSNVYNIIAQLHRIHPSLLTTVMGTISHGLSSPDKVTRRAVTELLGQLFSNCHDHHNPTSASISSLGGTSGIAAHDYPRCFRDWLSRQHDVDPEIRKRVVYYSIAMIQSTMNRYQSTLIVTSTTGTTSSNYNSLQSFGEDVTDVLVTVLTTDPDVDVRLDVMLQVSQLIHKNKCWTSRTTTTPSSSLKSTAVVVPAPTQWLAKLLRAVGSRVQSKDKDERRHAVTALGKLYYHFINGTALKSIQSGGDDADLGLIQAVLHKYIKEQQSSSSLSSKSLGGKRQRSSSRSNQHLYDPAAAAASHDDNPAALCYGWIPKMIFESVWYSDNIDPDMRNRVVQVIDEVLLGTSAAAAADGGGGAVPKGGSNAKSTTTSSSHNPKKVLAPTAHAVGLAIVLDSLRDEDQNLLLVDCSGLSKVGTGFLSSGGGGGSGNPSHSSSNAFRFLLQLFHQRSNLQRALNKYLDARANIRNYRSGTEEVLVAEATARELLNGVAALTAPVTTSSPSLECVLDYFHRARDKHIFRILGTITDPCQKGKTRSRALNDLPKRTKSLGDVVSTWVKNLVRRCTMGDFLNEEVIAHCAMLAQECFVAEDIRSCSALLVCVKVAASIFPSLCGQPKTLETLTELFSDCRAFSSTNALQKREMDESGLITALSGILSAAVPSSVGKENILVGRQQNDELQKELIQLCTRDGTPEQARNAVYALAKLFAAKASGKDDESSGKSGNDTQNDDFVPLLKSLTSPSRLDLGTKANSVRIISTLSALAAVSDCAPSVFVSSERGQKAIKFALESILMGRTVSGGEESDEQSDAESTDDDEEEEEVKSTSRKSRSHGSAKEKAKAKHMSPTGKSSLLEDDNLSIACRRVCSAIEFLVSCIRACLLHSTESSLLASFSENQIMQTFNLISQIVRDKGLPPSSRDRQQCKSRQDRAALRQCAAINLLRLCDTRVGLEKKHVTASMWHLLGESFLDEESTVREAIVDEFSYMLQGSGVYGPALSRIQAKSPALRFLAFTALCSDGHGLENDGANGNAANLGKNAQCVKSSVFGCVVNMRKVCDALFARCRANGKDAEQKFESHFKMMVMPEYMVPYALHLLSHRRETPCEVSNYAGNEQGDEDNEPVAVDDESQQKVLRKRLRLVFEPLVKSLGDRADNISFLLRMTEIVGKHYKPVDVAQGILKSTPSPPVGCDSSLDTLSQGGESKRAIVLHAKLRTVCTAAREVLLTFVKKDVNLSSYPGVIQLPTSLFQRMVTPSRLASEGAVSAPSRKESLDSHKPQAVKTVDSTSDKVERKRSSMSSDDTIETKRRSPRGFPMTSRATVGSVLKSQRTSASKSRVHFSPEVDFHFSARTTQTQLSEKEERAFGDSSPILKSASPTSVPEPRSGATLGSSPPSELRIKTLASTAPSSEEGSRTRSNRLCFKPGAKIVVAPLGKKKHSNGEESSTLLTAPESQITNLTKGVKSNRPKTASRKKAVEVASDVGYDAVTSSLESSQESTRLSDITGLDLPSTQKTKTKIQQHTQKSAGSKFMSRRRIGAKSQTPASALPSETDDSIFRFTAENDSTVNKQSQESNVTKAETKSQLRKRKSADQSSALNENSNSRQRMTKSQTKVAATLSKKSDTDPPSKSAGKAKKESAPKKTGISQNTGKSAGAAAKQVEESQSSLDDSSRSINSIPKQIHIHHGDVEVNNSEEGEPVKAAKRPKICSTRTEEESNFDFSQELENCKDGPNKPQNMRISKTAAASAAGEKQQQCTKKQSAATVLATQKSAASSTSNTTGRRSLRLRGRA